MIVIAALSLLSGEPSYGNIVRADNPPLRMQYYVHAKIRLLKAGMRDVAATGY